MMVKYYVCYTLLFLIQFCDGAVQPFTYSERDDVYNCVKNIIQRMELVDITDVTLINVNDTIIYLLHTTLSHPVRFLSRTYYWPNDTLYNDVYVIQCADYFQFSYGLDLIKRDPFWNPRAKFVIIIEYLSDFLQDVSVLLIHNHIYDVAIITYDDKEQVVVYTFGLEHDECDRPAVKELQLLSQCSEVHNIKKVYVSARKTSLRGCHVKFISHNFWPFVSFTRTDAVESFLLRLIRDVENITVELINYGEVEKFGNRLENFTYTGMLHEIETYNVEGAVGGYILTLNRMQNMDFVNPYMVDHYKIVIARAKQLGKWSAVLKQLSIFTVILVCFIFFIFCIIVTQLNIFERSVKDTSRDVLIVWGYFLNNITHKKNTKTGIPYRIILLNILLYVFIVSCATQASLLSATTHPIRDFQANSVEDVCADYQLILSPNLFNYLQMNPIVNLTNSKQICRATLDCITKVMIRSDEKLYTIASDIYHESNIWKFANDLGELQVHKISESIGTLLQTMYIRRGSPLAEPFDKALLRVRSAGLIDKYLEILQYSQRLKYTFHTRSGKKPQTLKGLIGVFMVLVLGSVISLIVFIFEIWYSQQ